MTQQGTDGLPPPLEPPTMLTGHVTGVQPAPGVLTQCRCLDHIVDVNQQAQGDTDNVYWLAIINGIRTAAPSDILGLNVPDFTGITLRTQEGIEYSLYLG